MCKHKINLHFCKHCCHDKARSITYSGCVRSISYPACKKHAPFYFVSCGMCGCIIIFHIKLHNLMKKVTERKIYVLNLSTNFA